MEEPLTILYTANLRGNLERLPRLHTFLRQLKNQRPADDAPDVQLCMVEPVARRTLLLDAGNACAPEVWHCSATGGRSALIVLDAMGYDAANVTGYLTTEGRARLDANYLGMALVDATRPWEERDVAVVCEDENKPSPPTLLPQGRSLRIVLPGETQLLSASAPENLPAVTEGLRPSSTGHDLYLPLVEAGQVGVIHIGWENGQPVIRARDVLEMPPNTAPDATITASIEFVLAEARRYSSL